MSDYLLSFFSFFRLSITLLYSASRAPLTCRITLGRCPRHRSPTSACTCRLMRTSSPQRSVWLAQPGRCRLAETCTPAPCKARGLPDPWADDSASCLLSSDGRATVRRLHKGRAETYTVLDDSSARNLRGIPGEFAPTADAVGQCGRASYRSCNGNATGGSTRRYVSATLRLGSAESHMAPWASDTRMFCGAHLHSCYKTGLTPAPS